MRWNFGFWEITVDAFNFADSLFCVGIATKGPDITSVVVSIVVSQVVFAWAIFFDKKCGSNTVDPKLRVFGNNFEVIDVGANVIVTGFIIAST